MNMLNRFFNLFLLATCALLLGTSLVAHADEIQDANKLFKEGKHDQALGKVNSFLVDKPKDAQARFLKGLILTEKGEITDAINIFSSLTEDYPELPEPYNNLAVLYASQGQYDNAKLALEMAIRTHPSYATAHENLGDIYAKMASQAYDRALQLDRSNTTTQTKLAMIQELFAGGMRGKDATIHSNPAMNKTPVETPDVVAGNIPETTKNVPATAIPALAPAPAPVTDSTGEVLKTVNAWAAAWSSQNADSYLSFYADDFKTPDGESRAVWEAARKERITAPKNILVSISNATVKFSDNDHATVKFRQSYRASHLNTSGKKTLVMIRIEGKWLIQEERSK